MHIMLMLFMTVVLTVESVHKVFKSQFFYSLKDSLMSECDQQLMVSVENGEKGSPA